MSNVKNKQIVEGTVEHMLISLFEPLQQLLDQNPGRINDASQDAGHERKSTGDAGIRIILDSMARQVHRQLRGTLQNSKTNDKYDNIVDRMNKSQAQMANHQETYAGDIEAMSADPRTYIVAHWFNVNMERFNAVNELMTGLELAYQHFTGEKWIYQDFGNASAPRSVDITPEAKAKALALFAAHTKTTAKAPEKAKLYRGKDASTANQVA